MTLTDQYNPMIQISFFEMAILVFDRYRTIFPGKNYHKWIHLQKSYLEKTTLQKRMYFF
jgi:hypothetical protein